MFVYDRFETLRKQLGITKKFIADAIIRTPAVCQDWKYGKSEPNDDQIMVVANILHTTPAYLRGETDDNKPPESKSREIGHDLKFALFGTDDIDDELFDEVKRFAQFARERYEQERGNK